MAPTMTGDETAPQAVEIAPAPHINPRLAAFEFAVTKAIADHAASRMKTLRERAVEAFIPSDRIPVVSPIDRRRHIATVSATDPKPEAVVTDRDELTAWFFEHYDERCEDVEKLVGSTAQVIAALRQYAPADVVDQLITVDRIVPDYEISNLLTRSAGSGKPIGPGGEIDDQAPPGVEVRERDWSMQVRLADDAIPHILELWRAGRIDPLGIDAPATAIE